MTWRAISVRPYAVVRQAGTAADKIAAATVLVQEDPVANLRSLETLLALVEKARVKGGKRGATQAVASLQELFRDALLPPDRKLRYFSEQPLAASAAGPHERKRLLYWHIEDLVKRAYTRFVTALETLSRDPLPVLKVRSAACRAPPPPRYQPLTRGFQSSLIELNTPNFN